MIGKNNQYLKNKKEGTKVETYSIKKFKVGTASVVIGASIFFGAGAVAQASEEVSNNTTSDNTTNSNASEGVAAAPKATAQPVAKETTKEDVASAVAAKLGGETAQEVKALDKTKLERYVAEIEAKLDNGTYANKTEASIALLKADLEAAKTTLANAKTQDELTKAYSKLVTTANTKLKAKPVEKKETPEVDTTNGKQTVGKKAENTEPSAANSHAIPANAEEGSGFRRNDSGAPQVTSTVNYEDASYVRRNGVTSADTSLSGTGTDGKTVVVTVATPGGATKTYETVVTNGKWTVNLEAPLKSGNDPHNKLTEETKITVQYKGENNKLNDETRVYLGRPKFVSDTIVAGQKEVLVKVPKDANNLWVGFTGSWDRQVIMNGGNPQSQDTSTLTATMADTQNDPLFHIVKLTFLQNVIKEGANVINLQAQSGYSAAGGAKPGATEAAEAKRPTITATNEAPTITATNNGSDVVVRKDSAFDIATLATVADKEDDAKLTVGEPVKAKLVSVNGASATTFNTATPGEYTLVLKAVDSQGKESTNTITRKVIVRELNAPTVDTNPRARGTVLSTDEKLSGTGVVGATVKVTVRNPEKTEVLLEKTATVNAEGKWEIKLDAGLNSNEALLGARENARTFYKNKPKNPVEIVQMIDGIESEAKEQDVSIGPSAILPSAAAKDGKSVVAGAKEVTFTVPHDAGFTYFFYTNKETNKEVQLDIKREDDGSLVMAGGNASKATVKNTVKGPFYDTVTLTLTEPVKEGVDLKVIPHNGGATKGTYLGKTSYPVTNEAPVVAPVVENQNEKTVLTETTITKADLLALVKVTDREDDQDATLGDKGHVRVVSVDGNTNVTGIDTSEAGEHTVIYKAVDSQGKESNEYEYTVKVNQAPTVELPYSNAYRRQIYIYTGEKTDLTFTGKDETTVKDLYLRNKGKDESDNASVYGFTIGKVTNSAVASGEGTVSDDKKIATIKMVGVTKLSAGQKWTSFIEAKDNDGVKSMPANEPYNVESDPALRQKKPGYVEFIVKSQADKYDIKAPTEKVAVADPTNVTEDDLAKIKEKLQLEYNQNNDDANISKDAPVTDKDAKIASVTKDADGNLVVTYTDGSKDTRSLSEFVTLDKQPAIDAVTTEADNKIKAITDNANLSQAEKDAAIAKVNAGKHAALDKIDEATNKTAVDGAKTEGTDAVAKVNPVAKEKAKQAISDELKAKNNELDARTDLSDAEKAEAKKEAKKLADAQLAEIAKQPDDVPTVAEAQTAQDAVDAAKNKGVADIKTVNPIAKESALKAVADELAEKEKQIDARTDLTKEEKDAAKEEAKRLAKTATDTIKAQPNTAATPEAATTAQKAVNDAKDDGVKKVKAVNPPAEKKTAAKQELANTADAKKQAIQDDNTLSEAAKEKLKKEVDDIKEATDAAITGAKKNADVDKVKLAAAQAIKAINSARIPGNKLVAKNPTNLDGDEQDKLKKAIEAVNPGATVEVNPDGSAKVTYPGKAPETLKQADLTKSAADLDNPGGGNNINRPADKVIVKNPANLTDDEKEKVKKAVRDVNPNAVVTMDDNGTVTVSTPDGHTAAFPASELVRTLADAAKGDSGNTGVRKPADKVVGDATNLADQAKATAKLKKLNGPDAKVQYDAEGNATVVLKDGTIATIPAGDLFKTPEDAKKANGGDDINKPNSQTVVADKNALTEGEREAIKAKIAAVNPEGSVITVNEKGEATVTTPEGKTAVIDADDLIKGADEKTTAKAGNNINNPADRVQVADKANLKPEDIAKIKAAVETVNPGSTVVVDEKGNATVTTPEGKTATIPVSELVKTPTDKENVNGGNQVNTPADRVVVENPAALTSEEKKAIEAKIKAVNPDADVVFDEKGNATVTTKDGKTATIPASDLVKPKADLADPTKQDAVNKPVDKVIVDPALVAADKDLPQEAKDAIKAAVAAVNPGATVVVDDKGNATVTTKDGKTVVISKADLVKTEADKETAKAGNNINKPADKVVADKDALTPENIEAIKAKVAAVNPGATVVVDDKGNATVVTPDGKTATIPVTDLVKSPTEAEGAKAGNDVNKPADKVVVNDPANLTPEEKKAIEAKVKAVNPDAKVFVDEKGNATVSTPDGKTATIPVEDLVKDPAAKETPSAGNKVNTPATKVVVKDPANIKADEEKIKAEILKVNPGATVVFDTEGNATVTTKDGAVATIPASDLAKDAADLQKADKQDAVNKPADKTVVKKAGELTSKEKEDIKKEIAKVNRDPQTTIVVDDEGNATVTTPDGKTEVIPASDLVKTAEEAEGVNAGNNINKPADKVAAAAADLVGPKKDEVAAKIKAAVESVNPGATVFVDDKGNATVTTPDGKTATIPVEDLLKDPAAKETPSAGNKVNTPAEKALVDPAVLNDPNTTLPKDVKDAIKKAVESVNPGAEVVVDDKGNATVTVTNPDGTKATATIPASDLVKSNAKEDLENAAKQDAIKKPIDETVVANKDALTLEEKKAIEDKVKEVNPGATVVVDEKGNATVTTPEGKTAVIPADDLVKTADEVLTDPKAGNVINKPADRELVDNKDNLTPEDIKAIKDRVVAVNPGASVYVDDKGNATVTTPDGQTATIPVNDLVKTEADKNTANAGNKVNTPADKVLVKDPAKLTAKELEKVEKKIKEVNPDATVVFDDKGNATVKNANGDIATIPAADLVKPKADLLDPAKQDAVKKPADKTLVKNPDSLTQDEKDAITAKVKEVNPPADGTIVFVDEKGNATVTTKDGKTVVIPKDDLVKTAEEAANEKAGNNINKPADKTVVAKPDALTPEEKKVIEDKVKAVNPDAKAVFVDDKGNATVTLKGGKSATIPATDLVKTAEDAAKPNAGNKVNAPADKVVVKDPDALTDADKAKITDAIKAINPNAEKVVFDEYGNATVTTKDGEVATIPAADLVKTEAEAAKPNAGNNINTPADKVAVDSSKPLTEDDKKAIAAKVAEVNPGATVAVDDKGNATVTTPEGKTAVIPATDLTKTADSAKEPNAGNDVVKPADKTVVANPDSLTQDEQNAIAAKVAEVNPEAKTVVVDDKGNATVTTKDGKAVVIPAKDLVKTAEEAVKPNAGNDVNTPADKTVVANPDSLTQDEKDAIIAKVKAVNPGAEVVVDEKGNATVTTPEGKTAVIPASDLTKTADSAKEPNAGNDVSTPADKTVVKNPDSLTQDEKDVIVAKVKAVNPDATVVVDDKGNATVTPKDGKPVVIPASDLTKTEAQAKEPKAGNDIVKPADKTVVKNPDSLTQDEKDAIVAKVKAVNPGAEVVVDDKGNATVTVNGKTAVIPATDLTKSADAEKAPKAGNDIVKPASKTKVANPDSLTSEEKKAIADKVAAVNPGSTVVVDDKGNATVTLPNGNTAVIPASDLTKSAKDVNDGKAKDNAVTPAAKTKVANPEKLTDAEKKAIEDKVKALNPGATVVVDDKGNATVVKDGNVSVIPSTDLVKVEDDATKPNGGNDANTPAAKTVVANSEKLTDAEKKEIIAKVKAVNPGATVVVDDKGNATVTKGDGTVLNIPASDLVIPAEKFADEAKTAKVKTPAIRTLVGDKENLTKDEKEAVKKSIEAVNPGATVVVDNKGNATVTMPDGSTATISKEQLVKNAEDAKAKHGGDNLDFDFSKVTVGNLENITSEEKAKFQFQILGTITNVEEFDLDAYIKSTDDKGNTVYTSKDSRVKITIDKDGNATIEKDGKKELAINIDKAGNVTIVTKEGKVLAIPRDGVFRQKPTLPEKIEVGNVNKLTDEEKAAVKAALIKANPELTNAKITIADNGKATIEYLDGHVIEIAATDLVTAKAFDKGSNAQGANTKLGQRLANTGTTETNTGLAGLGLAVLGGLLAAARRRKEK
ncbi:DUF1542 domain-containing protein [Gemella haemolysans]|uniref:DUF1542 domain-containing protein n=1 Tax=Gemella haemolysans TaxID=1379 RepID=UPI001959C2E0|nr:DUF1542 domain-containing protein [Gemella haemolysans]VTX59841.1 Extracellular matrix-binding protein ebh [Gemella haemolysans]